MSVDKILEKVDAIEASNLAKIEEVKTNSGQGRGNFSCNNREIGSHRGQNF